MTRPADLERVYAALAGFKSGSCALSDFEGLVGSVIAAGTLKRSDVLGALDLAVIDGTLPPGTLRRLGLDDTLVRSSLRSAEADPASDATRLRTAPSSASFDPVPVSKDTISDGESIAPSPSRSVGIGYLLDKRYLLERELGEGGMGIVYLASDQNVKGEVFAIKVLKPEISIRSDSVELLREEVRKTRALHHSNIVGVYSLNADNGCVYMLMEYLEGKTLRTLLDDDFGRGMPLMRAWPLIKDIGAALAYAHDHGVIHSDLKPANVFVTTSGKAMLLDFGIARAVRARANRFDTSVLGALTPAYASCEMLEGRAADQRDDVFSFACVTYEMLSGRHPFDRRDWKQAHERAQEDEGPDPSYSALEARARGLRPAPLPSLRAEQNCALACALTYDRATRTPSVEALLEELEALQKGRKPVLRFVLAIAALVVVAALSYVVIKRAGVTTPDRKSAPILATEGSRATLNELHERADRSKRELAVDPSQKAWQTFTQKLAAAKTAADAGDSNFAQLVADAESALDNALQRGIRWMKIGSGQTEIDQAVKLCAEMGTRCSPTDFADETAKMVQLKPFEMDRIEVTNREFAEFASATGYETQAERAHGLYDYGPKGAVFRAQVTWRTLRDSIPSKDAPDYPVRGIDFDTAVKFCDWRHRRLPTGDEWEFVARGPERRIFPWGDKPSHDVRAGQLMSVDEQPATGRFGNRGLGGSLWEWVDDGAAQQRVLRGASWRDRNLVDQRLAARRAEDPAHPYVDTGFRCARYVDVWPRQSP